MTFTDNACTRLQSYIVLSFFGLCTGYQFHCNLFVGDITRTLSFRVPGELTVGDF